MTVDGRTFGVIGDGKEMLSAAAAVARFAEIGVSRDFVNAPRRAAGDAVSRFGMGSSFVEAVPMTLARALHHSAPAVPSTPLFVLVPVLCLAGCAWAMASALGRAGVPRRAAAWLGGALPFTTPLWGYAGSDYSEALQALLIALLLLAVVARRSAEEGRTWGTLAGLSFGLAVLTKSFLVAPAAVLLLAAAWPRPAPAAGGRGSRRPILRLSWGFAAAAAPPLLLWLLLELARFGRLFGGYAGESFAYPFLTGLLRLTLLPNKGLFFYAPVLLLAPAGFVLLARRDRVLAWAALVSALAVLLPMSAWWAWDGQAGWGPRLLVPALPPLFFLAALAIVEGRRLIRAVGICLLGSGTVVNLIGALMPFAGVYALAGQVPPQPITEARAAGTLYEIEPGPGGTLLATGPHHLSLTPDWSPIRIHARLLLERIRGGDVASRLQAGALADVDPPFVPRRPDDPAPAFIAAVAPFSWPFWGRCFFSREPAADPYRGALRDQAVRAIDMKDDARALMLASELLATGDAPPNPADAALAAEAALRLGRRAEAGRLLHDSREPCHPWVLFVGAELREGAPDLSCLPEAQRPGFARGLELARLSGWPVTAWSRAALSGRP